MSKNKHGTIAFGKGDNRLVLLHMNKPIRGGVIGMVKSKLFQFPVAVIIDETPTDDRDYSFACLACAENGVAPRILIDRELFYDIIRGSVEARVILLHELGHYHHQHLSQQVKDRDTARMDCASAGFVDPNELEADRFVASYLGREKTIMGLKCLMERLCKEYADYDEDSLQIAADELKLRIAALEVTGNE